MMNMFLCSIYLNLSTEKLICVLKFEDNDTIERIGEL